MFLTRSAREPSRACRQWALNKKNPTIAAGVVHACSNMTEEVWNKLESHSNAAEQAGNKSYKTGTGLSLLEGIQR
mgnify:CR=1 FL=1